MLSDRNPISIVSISLWLGVPSYLYFAVAWSSELFVFRCGLEFRAFCISLWLRVPSYLYFAVAWSSELSFVSGLIYPGDSLFCPWSGLSTREWNVELWLSLLTLALCFHVQGGWGGSSGASPSSIIAADHDDLERQRRLRRGAPWLWKEAQEARDHGLRKFNSMQCM